jgi:hypothetical protein
MPEIVFGGCGGSFPYFMGIADYIQVNYDLANCTFAGVSAGCLPAVLLATDHNVYHCMLTNYVPLLQDTNKSWSKAIGRWNDLAWLHTMAALDNEKDYQRANRCLKLYLAKVTKYIPFRTQEEIVSNWHNNGDLVNCMRASGFVPIYDTTLFGTFRDDTKYIDGVCAFNEPLNNPLYFHTQKWKHFGWWDMICGGDKKWGMDLFYQGWNDAYNHRDELNTYLTLYPEF